MESSLEQRLQEQRNRDKKRAFTAVVISLLLFSASIASGFWLAESLNTPGSIFDRCKQAFGFAPVQKKINILVLGIDERQNDIGRSNVTCVVTVDNETKKVSMLWIPRDSRVKIPGHGWNKIGHAYSYGGHELSEKTVSDLLGINIDHYLVVNMAGFRKAIDAMGGVDINVEKRLYYYDPYDEGYEVDNNGLIDLKPGMQHLDGNKALQYVRFRHDEMGDIGRIERQEKFVKALLTQIVNPATFARMPSIVSNVTAAVSTDIPASQMLALGKMVNDAHKEGLKTDMVPGKPVYIDGLSYWLPDIVAARDKVAQIEGFTIDDKYIAASRTAQRDYTNSLAKVKVVDAQ